jgi:hypothetical protein
MDPSAAGQERTKPVRTVPDRRVRWTWEDRPPLISKLVHRRGLNDDAVTIHVCHGPMEVRIKIGGIWDSLGKSSTFWFIF